jgi:hypothetical protein
VITVRRNRNDGQEEEGEEKKEKIRRRMVR